MKRTSYPRFLARAAMTLLAVFCFLGARAQTTVEIGDGTSAGYYTPIGTYYSYSITEQLYTDEEIGTAGTITSISFNYAYTDAKDFPITVYMANVDAADLSTGISLAEAEKVFDGTLSVTGAGWATIDLDAPFAYDGTSNLLIGINKGYCQWFSGNTWYYTAADGMARYSQNDGNAYDISTTVPGTVTNNRPNIRIEITPGGDVQICTKPSTFVVSDITTTSATFEWEDTGAGSYSFEYKKASDTEWTAVSVEGVGRGDASIKTYTLSDLVPGTSYNVRVKAICGEDSESGYKTLNFTTSFGIPLVEEFGTSIPTGWAMYSGLLDEVMAGAELTTANYGWSFGSNNGVFDNHARVNIYGTSCRYWLVTPTLLMENNVQLMFDVAYTAYSGTGGAPQQTGTDDKFVVLINDGSGWTILRQWNNTGSEYVLNDLNATPATVTLDLSSYAGQSIAIAFYGESTASNADNNLHIDNVSIDYIPACPKPTNLAVSYEGGTTATVTWEGTADAYNIDVNGTVTNGVTSPYTLENLELGTTYEVKVEAACDDDETSDWTNAVSFKTDNCMPEDMCQLTFTVTDSYGDGWNGAAIVIYDYTGGELGDLLATVTNQNLDGQTNNVAETQTTTLNFCNGQELAIIWQSGSYDSECSYTITDINGEIVAQDDTELAIPYTIDCTVTDCRRPTDFAASNIGPHSVELSWTENGEATAWEIAYMAEDDEDITTITVESNPYTLEGLDPETMYYAQVSPVCEVDKPSEVISWTTTVAAPAPTDLASTPLVTSADVSWNGFAESYELEYAEGTFGGGWLQYDDGSFASIIGGNTETEWTWGVMYPGSMVTADELTKVSIYEKAGYNTEDITINIYSGGDDAPGELLYTETVTPEAADAFHEITLASPVAITPGKNLWITLTETGTYVLTVCASDEPNNNWVNNGGTWVHLSDVNSSLAGYGWMIRAELSGDDPSTATWIAVSNPTNPCTLEGLNPETTYTFRVRGDFGDEGMSDWAMSTFTTKVGTEDPIDLTAETTSTTATLDWTGYQKSYNVQYREALEIDPTAPATIILEADDVWEDGSGYQMLLDADANTSGVLWDSSHKIYVDGEQYSGGDLPSSYYDEFEYIIPTNAADGSLEAPNSVVTGSVTITIPAGTYDFVILNPTPGDRFYIAAAAGDVETANDDFVFEAGKTYHFTMQIFGENDGAALEVTSPMGDWTTVEGVTNPYELTGLTPDTYYEWQVQGILDDGTTNWVSGVSFTTLPLIELANDDSENEADSKNSAIIATAAKAGKPVDVKLAGRTLFKDGEWNTICLPFDVTDGDDSDDLTFSGTPLEGATAKELTNATMTGTHVTLTFDDVTELEAGKPYIIKWAAAEENISEPTFTGVLIQDVAEADRTISPIPEVKFIGYYNAFGITATDENIYYMTADNTLKHTKNARTLKACRAYFDFTEAAITGRQFILDFGDGEVTGITDVNMDMNASGWYTVDGKKLDKQPKRKGVYINNGIKVVIK